MRLIVLLFMFLGVSVETGMIKNTTGSIISIKSQDGRYGIVFGIEAARDNSLYIKMIWNGTTYPWVRP